MKLALVLMLMLMSCGKEETKTTPAPATAQPVPQDRTLPKQGPLDPRTAENIDARFLEAVEFFEEQSGRTVTTPMEFSTLEQGVLGVCIIWGNGSREVREILIDEISYSRFLNIDVFGAYNILIHELGHCEEDRDHIRTLAQSEDGVIPFSIMFPAIFEDLSLYTKYAQHYINELFGGPGLLVPVREVRTSRPLIKIIRRGGFTGTVIHN